MSDTKSVSLLLLFITFALILSFSGCSSSNKTIDYSIPTSPDSSIDSLQIYTIDQVDQAPKPKGGYAQFLGAMRYPEEARKDGATGRVVIRVVVSPQGQPISPYVRSSPHPALSQESLRIVKNGTFEPGIKDGKAVYSWTELPITYQLAQNPNM